MGLQITRIKDCQENGAILYIHGILYYTNETVESTSAVCIECKALLQQTNNIGSI